MPIKYQRMQISAEGHFWHHVDIVILPNIILKQSKYIEKVYEADLPDYNRNLNLDEK